MPVVWIFKLAVALLNSNAVVVSGGGTWRARGLSPPRSKSGGGGLSPSKYIIHEECQNARPFIQTTKSSNYCSPAKMQTKISYFVIK
jgi:hypothetical protein